MDWGRKYGGLLVGEWFVLLGVLAIAYGLWLLSGDVPADPPAVTAGCRARFELRVDGRARDAQ